MGGSMHGGEGLLDELLNLVGSREGSLDNLLRRALETIACFVALRSEPSVILVDESHVAAYVAVPDLCDCRARAGHPGAR